MFAPKAAVPMLVLAVVLAYANSVGVPFVYDDILAIPQNASLRSLWPLSEVLFPRVDGGVTVSGRPVLNFSFALNYAISGTAVWSYHVFNILIHAANALLVYGIARRTIALTPRTERPDKVASQGEALPFVAAAIWALHPLQTQAVTYTVQRAESLMGFFYLLTLYAFIRAVTLQLSPGRHAASNREAKTWTTIAVAACALGMGTKEVMATAPLLVLLYDRTFIAGSFGAALRQRWRVHLALFATWLVLLGVMLSTGGNRGGTVGFGVGLSLWAYPLTQFKALATYLWLSLWPSELVFEYGTFWAQSVRDVVPYSLLVVPLLGLTLYGLLNKRQSWRTVGFLGGWFFLILAPTSLAPGTIQMIVEHRMYLPLAAIAVASAVALRRLFGRRGLMLGALSAAALAVATAARNQDYHTSLALWEDTVAKRPENPRAYEGMAEALEAAGSIAEAIRQREKSVALAPKDAHVRFNFALALANLGRTEEAIAAYRESLRLDPSEARAHNNLAILLAQTGDHAPALGSYSEAVRLRPSEAAYRQNFGSALLRVGKPDAALEQLAAAARVRPDDIGHAMRHGTLLIQLRRFDEGIAVFEGVVKQAPENPAVRLALAEALLDADRVVAAIPHYLVAVQLAPENAEAQHNLGTAYARIERWDEAQRAFEAALRLRPDHQAARRNLEQLRRVRR